MIKQCSHCGNDFELLRGKTERCPSCRKIPDPRCKKCKKVKPITAFARDAGRPSGYFPWCLECSAKATKAANFQNPDDPLNGHIDPLCGTPVRGHRNRRFCSNSCKERVGALKRNFNLSPEQYNEMVTATSGVCPICLKRPTQWHVEHNHKTREVTGLVCSACNAGALATTYHDVDYVVRLLRYLVEPPAAKLGIHALASQEYNRPAQVHRVWEHRRITRK